VSSCALPAHAIPTAIAAHSCDVIAAAVDRFGVCSVTAIQENQSERNRNR
jgi:hypothetical protein